MTDSVRSYAAWKAPVHDGGHLLWPEPQTFLADTRRNGAQLRSADASVQNAPLHELRSAMRGFLGVDQDTPIVATGHQAELIHTGVWAKACVIDAAARTLGGRAMFVLVDTDAPKHLHLKWPADDAHPQGNGSIAITDDDLTKPWTGLLDPPTPAHLQQVERDFAEAAGRWPFKPNVPQVLSSIRRFTLEGIEGTLLPASLANAMHELDWSLGLRHEVLLLSPMLDQVPYLALAHHLLARAGEVALQYNAALAAFREEQNIDGVSRPVPDLAADGQRVETPFWLDDLATGQRSRAVVKLASDGKPQLTIGTETFTFDPDAPATDAAAALSAFCRRSNHRLRPRALTLTLFFRLFAFDQFVHGIGGGLYDQVTDRLIGSLFDIEPPRFSVATATLFFPTAAERERACPPCLKREGHHLRHGVLGEAKRALVAEIQAAPRLSAERQLRFNAMQRQLVDAAEHDPRLNAWRARLGQAEARQQIDEQLFDRELFYALQPSDRLQGVIDRFARAFA